MVNNKIGVDITFNKRFDSYIKDESKCRKILSLKEIEYLRQITSEKRRREYIARCFAAKEALYKAMNFKSSFTEISILNRIDGSPYVEQTFTDKSISISISHEEDYTIAFVIIN